MNMAGYILGLPTSHILIMNITKIAASVLYEAAKDLDSLMSRQTLYSTNALCISSPEKDMLVLSRLDGSTAARVTLATEVKPFKPIFVSASLFTNVIQAMNTNETIVTLNMQKDMLSIKNAKSQFDLRLFSDLDWYELDMPETLPIEVESDVLLQAFEQVLVAVSSNTTRPILTGVSLDMREDDVFTLASTDSYRLAQVAISGVVKHDGIIIPANILKGLSKYLSKWEDKDLSLEIGATDSFLGFRIANLEICSRLINGKFPNMGSIVNAKREISMTATCTQLADALERAAILTEKDKPNVLLIIKPNELGITAESHYGKAQESIAVDTTGIDTEYLIKTNPVYLTQALHHLVGDVVKIHFSADGKSVYSVTDEDETVLYLIMPIIH